MHGLWIPIVLAMICFSCIVRNLTKVSLLISQEALFRAEYSTVVEGGVILKVTPKMFQILALWVCHELFSPPANNFSQVIIFQIFWLKGNSNNHGHFVSKVVPNQHALVFQRADNFIYWIIVYPVDKRFPRQVICFICYLMDSSTG